MLARLPDTASVQFHPRLRFGRLASIFWICQGRLRNMQNWQIGMMIHPIASQHIILMLGVFGKLARPRADVVQQCQNDPQNCGYNACHGHVMAVAMVKTYALDCNFAYYTALPWFRNGSQPRAFAHDAYKPFTSRQRSCRNPERVCQRDGTRPAAPPAADVSLAV